MFSRRLPALTLGCCLLSVLTGPATLCGQDAAEAPARPPADRWLVSLSERSFDLAGFRRAVHEGASASAVASIVEELEAAALRDQAALVEVVEDLGGRVYRQWWLVNACAIELPADRLPALRERVARIVHVAADRYARPGWIKTATNTKNHQVDPLHAKGIKGKGVTIAVVDTGLDVDMNGTGRPHRSFFVNGDVNNKTGGGIGGSRVLANVKVGLMPADDFLGHGTAVAAVAGGEVWASSNADPGHAPLANLVGYSIADDPQGFALLSTMVSAFQAMSADKVKYGIAVGNLSYDGSEPPYWVEQQAIDAAVLNADIFVAVMGGNGGTSTHYSHGATNVLAAGAVESDNHRVATFSSRGPMAGGQRAFPDIAANGVQIVTPLIDDESKDRIGTGTSYAAPQVAGAAALYRSLKPAATALETRAALLASTEDISVVNSTGFSTVNAYGQGYLRDDELVKIAQGGATVAVQNANLTPATMSRNYQVQVTAGKFYVAALAWYRYDTGLPSGWSDLSLIARQGSNVLVSSDRYLNTYERIEFRPTQSGTVTLTVGANTLEPGLAAAGLPFSLVFHEALPFASKSPAMAYAFGTECLGSVSVGGRKQGPRLTLLSEPALGRAHTASLGPVVPGVMVAFVIGVSDQVWGTLQLPVDLTPIGGTGCRIYTSIDLLSGFQTFSSVARHSFAIPNTPSLIGVQYYLQGAAADPLANAMRMTTSNGLVVRIGTAH